MCTILFRPFAEIRGFGGDSFYLLTRKQYFEINSKHVLTAFMILMIIIIIAYYLQPYRLYYGNNW